MPPYSPLVPEPLLPSTRVSIWLVSSPETASGTAKGVPRPALLPGASSKAQWISQEASSAYSACPECQGLYSSPPLDAVDEEGRGSGDEPGGAV